MITTTIVHKCRSCESTNIVKNGHNRCGNQQYKCKDCGTHRVLQPKHNGYSEDEKATICRASLERVSMRGLTRIFNVSRQTVKKWIKESVQRLPPLIDTIAKLEKGDVLEVDEMWTFGGSKKNKRWLWTVMCRRTRQIIAFVIGDHSKKSCQKLWNRIPEGYRQCASFSDFWASYDNVFPSETHQSVGKETGETAHIERWYGTLRQRLARVVRQTLSFSKSEPWHHMFIKWFITLHNQQCLSSLTR